MWSQNVRDEDNKDMMIWRRIFPNLLQKAFRRKYLILPTVILIVLTIFRYNSPPNTAYKNSIYLRVFGENVLPHPDQKTIDYIAKHVQLSFTILDNLHSGKRFGQGGYFLASFTLFNGGPSAVPATRWQLFGYSMRLAEPAHFPYPFGVYIVDCGLKMFHMGGSLYRFEPAGGFITAIEPGGNLTCTIQLKAFQVARTDSMPNWFVTGQNLEPKTLQSTSTEDLQYVKPFIFPRQYLRRRDDTYRPYSAAQRYNMYSSAKEQIVPRCNVIPTPLSCKVDPQQRMDFSTTGWVIVQSQMFPEEVKYMEEAFQMKIAPNAPARRYVRFIKKPVNISTVDKVTTSEEAYELETDIKNQIITITTNSKPGALYGIQTLRSLIFTPEAHTGNGILVRLPLLKIVDAPRFQYRGLHIDVARNFHPKGQILKTIEAMAMYKMNKLHLHLSDDEGWRLEIPGIPELTEIGSKRCYDPDEQKCILPMLGSGPDFNSSGSGYYSIGDYKEILIYASRRHIDVIPEIDMPGHSRAAIKSLHAQSQQSLRRKMKSELFSVLDEDDHSKYLSGQLFTDDVINPCVQSTYTFVKRLMEELRKMHEGILPLRMFHFGGDEVAKGAWSNSSACKRLQKAQPELKTEYDLMKYFITRVTTIASDLDLVIGAWEDGVISHGSDHESKGLPFSKTELKNDNIYAYVWKRPIESQTPHRARLLVNNGYKVVLAYGSYLYFDHPYEPDPEERGLYWATRKISTRDVWDFTPNVMQNDIGLTCPRNVKDKTDCFDVKHPENIVGIQAQLWTETVRTAEQMDNMLFPRLLAVAERAWHKASWEGSTGAERDTLKRADWIEFINIVGNKELRRLESLNVQYRVPPPGALVNSERKVSFSTEFPGLDIEYFSDDSQSWQLVHHLMPITSQLRIRTRSHDWKRHSREVIVHTWDTLTSSGSGQYFNNCIKYFYVPFIVIFIKFTLRYI